jgi:hypothetical protein
MITWPVSRPVEFVFTSSSFGSTTFSSTESVAGGFLLDQTTTSSSVVSFFATTNQNGRTSNITSESGRTQTASTLLPEFILPQSTVIIEGTSVSTQLVFENTSLLTTTTNETTIAVTGGISSMEILNARPVWTTSQSNNETVFATSFAPLIEWYEDIDGTETTTVVTTEIDQTLTGANAFDTVYEDPEQVFAVFSEEASQFVNNKSAASAFAQTTGTSVVVPHLVKTRPVIVIDETRLTGDTVSIPASTEEVSVTYETISFSGVEQLTENWNASIIPNVTLARSVSLWTRGTTESTNNYVAGGYAGVNETTTTAVAYSSPYTTAAFLRDEFYQLSDSAPVTQAVINLDGPPSSFEQTVQYPNIAFTSATTINAESAGTTREAGAGGNTTFSDNELAAVGHVPGAYQGLPAETFMGYMAVYKPYGIMLEGELVGAVSIDGTTLTGLSVAALSRNNIYRGDRVSYLNQSITSEGGSTRNRLLLSYPDQSNDTFTISGKSVTHTVQDGSRMSTTSKVMFGIAPSSVGFIGGRYWFGGAPEESATFYQTIGTSVCIDQLGQTSVFDGSEITELVHGQEQELKYWQPLPEMKDNVNFFTGIREGLFQTLAYPGSTYCFLAP